MKIQLKNKILMISGLEDASTDAFFSRYHISKKTRYAYYQKNLVKINHRIVRQDTPITKHSSLQIMMMEEEEDNIIPWFHPISVIYEDDLFLMVDKPSMMLVHSDGVNNEHTLSNIVKGYYIHTAQNCPVRAIHRLDKETTGLIVFCKLPFFQPLLDHMLQEKAIERQYYAVCSGILKEKKQTINQAIARDRHHAQKMRIAENGKASSTTIYVLQSYQNYTWIECHLHSGRTHQIRVHMASIGHPLLSDPLYGSVDKCISRLALHAYRICLFHPLLQQSLIINSPIPEDIKKLLRQS